MSAHRGTCRWHHGLCAYGDDDDETRCMWCHCTWDVILSTGYHSCGHIGMWGGDPARKTKVLVARQMREAAARHAAQAACAASTATTRSGVGSRSTPEVTGPQDPPEKGPQR
jgi:hypothetical protein